MKNLPKLFAAGALTLFFATLIVLLSIVWGHAADIPYPIVIGATDYTGYQIIRVVDTIPTAGSVINRASSMPDSTTYTLDNTKQNQLRVRYRFGTSDWISADLMVDLRRAKTTRLVSRRYESPDVDTIYALVYSGGNSFALAYADTITSLPHTISWGLSANNMHMVREKWKFTGETDGEYSISQWHPVNNDSVITDTVNVGMAPPDSANVCRVHGFVKSAYGEYMSGISVRATLGQQVNNACDSTIVYGRTIRTKTDATGEFNIDLIRSGCLLTNSGDSVQWRLQIGDREGWLWVPDSSTYQLPHDWGM